MCDSHCRNISRRGFGSMALATAGMSLLPFAARAAQVDHLALMCIDFRLVDKAIAFFDSKTRRQPPSKRYDLVALAGASLASSATQLFEPTTHGFWQQVFAADKLHDIKKVFVLDHMGCGAFKEEFNGGQDLPPAREHALHVDMMTALSARFKAYYPELAAEYYLMADPNTVPYPAEPERIDI